MSPTAIRRRARIRRALVRQLDRVLTSEDRWQQVKEHIGMAKRNRDRSASYGSHDTEEEAPPVTALLWMDGTHMASPGGSPVFGVFPGNSFDFGLPNGSGDESNPPISDDSFDFGLPDVSIVNSNPAISDDSFNFGFTDVSVHDSTTVPEGTVDDLAIPIQNTEATSNDLSLYLHLVCSTFRLYSKYL